MKINLIRNLATNEAKIRVKKMSFAIALILIITASAFFVSTPANAITYPDRTVGASCIASPKLVGVGQQMTINLMLWPAKQDPLLYSWARETNVGYSLEQEKAALEAYYKIVGFNNVTVTITRPDGTKDIFMPVDASLQNVGLNVPGLMSLMGTTTFYYKPNMAGNWSVSFNYPGEMVYDSIYSSYNDTVYYKPATSNISYFTVQEDPVDAGLLNGWPWSPLPTGYWERPISIDNREWYQIGGYWPQSKWDGESSYNPYSTAPGTPHILWKERMYFGGIVGGDWGSWSYNIRPIGPGSPLIIDNLLFVQESTSSFFNCYDLRTGEKLYRSEGSISQIWTYRPVYQTVTQTEGVGGAAQPVLIDTSGGTWKLRSPFDGGAILQTITGPQSGISGMIWRDMSTEVYMYQRSNFNTTKPMQWATYNIIKWDFSKVTNNNWTTGVVWKTPVRQSTEFVPGDSGRSGFLRFDEAGVVVLCSQMENRWIAYDQITGNELWRKTTDFYVTNLFNGGPDGPIIGADPSHFPVVYQALDPKTGKHLWTSDPVGTGDMGGVPLYYEVTFANGNMYIGGFDGYIYAISLATGKLVWKSDYIGDTGETIFNTWAFGSTSTSVGGDGKLYFSTGIVYSTQPLSRFHKLYCVDAATGKFLWTLQGLAGGQRSPALADGYLVYPAEDGTYYCFNKGKTAVTVTTPQTSVSLGTSLLLQGTVMDMSPAQSGTPCVSEQDMSMWMNYLHMQNATLINDPPTPTGVSVKLWTVDPNGNQVDIGSVTSDSSGGFKMLWTPSIEGTYTVYATFSGSGSYWSSQGTTYVGVTAAPAATSTPVPLSGAQDAVPYAIGVGIAIIIAIAIVGLLLLRKRP